MRTHDNRVANLRTVAAAIGIVLTAATGSLQAADWSVNPRVTASAEYYDNTRMSELSEEQIEATGGALDAAVELRGDGQRGFFKAVPRIRSTFFPDESTEETTSWWLRTDGRYLTERSQFDIRADYSSIETLGPYIPISDGGGPIGQPNPGQGTGGNEEALNAEDRLFVAPIYEFAFTERHGMQLGAGYVDVSFDQSVDQDREDFSYLYGTAGYVYRLSPAKTVTLSVQGSRFEDEDGDVTGAQNASIQWTNEASETTLFYARAGVSRSEDELFDEWNTGFSGGVGVDWKFEVSRIAFEVSSDLDPNASGLLVQRDQLQLTYEHQLSPALTFRTVARYIDDSPFDDADFLEERQYANASLGLDWRFAREWTLAGTYTYRWRDFEFDTSSADSNQFSLGITYEPRRL